MSASRASVPVIQQGLVPLPSPSRSTEPPKVLLVDDDIPLLHTLSELLTDMGVTVVGTATDGAQVLPALFEAVSRTVGVDVVVLDVRMPDVDGLTAARQVRQVFPGIAVILHSAYAGQLADQPGDAGVFAEIAKGARPGDLMQAIHDACAASRAHGPRLRLDDQPRAATHAVRAAQRATVRREP